MPLRLALAFAAMLTVLSASNLRAAEINDKRSLGLSRSLSARQASSDGKDPSAGRPPT